MEVISLDKQIPLIEETIQNLDKLLKDLHATKELALMEKANIHSSKPDDFATDEERNIHLSNKKNIASKIREINKDIQFLLDWRKEVRTAKRAIGRPPKTTKADRPTSSNSSGSKVEEVDLQKALRKERQKYRIKEALGYFEVGNDEELEKIKKRFNPVANKDEQSPNAPESTHNTDSYIFTPRPDSQTFVPIPYFNETENKVMYY